MVAMVSVDAHIPGGCDRDVLAHVAVLSGRSLEQRVDAEAVLAVNELGDRTR